MHKQNPPNNHNPSDAPDRSGPMDRVNRAIRNPYNVLALALMVAVGAVALSVWPIVGALVFEAVYLGVAALRRQATDPPAAKPATVAADAPPQASGLKFGASRGQSTASRGTSRAGGAPVSMKKPAGQTVSELLGDGNECCLRLEATYRLIEL